MSEPFIAITVDPRTRREIDRMIRRTPKETKTELRKAHLAVAGIASRRARAIAPIGRRGKRQSQASRVYGPISDKTAARGTWDRAWVRAPWYAWFPIKGIAGKHRTRRNDFLTRAVNQVRDEMLAELSRRYAAALGRAGWPVSFRRSSRANEGPGGSLI